MLAILSLALVVQAAVVVPLQRRDKTSDEQRQLLEFLELGSGGESGFNTDGKLPVATLDSNFFGTIEVGDSKQEFKVVFDTGSSVIWVYSDKCESCKTSNKKMYSARKSHTFQARDIPFDIHYGTGASHGITASEEIFIADLEVQDQALGLCEEPDTVMRNFPFDGIVGLSRALVSDKNKMPTIISTIRDEKLLENKDLTNSFSFYIGREEGDPTYLIFGGSHDMLEKDKQVHWTPTLNKNIYWEIPLDDIFIHGKKPVAHGARSMEERPHLRMENDAFARADLDPEMALLEVEEEVSAMEERMLLSAPKPARRRVLREASGDMAKQLLAEEEGAARELEDRVKVHNMNHKKSSRTQSTEPAQGAGYRGEGQLMSQMHRSPGASMQPCQQDEEHMCLISVDSGHSLMSGPPDIIRSMKQKLTPPSGMDACSDEAMDVMPDVSFAIGGKLFTMTPEDYLIKLEGRCVPAFSERQTRNGHDWVLGEHFMRTFYTVFDHDNMRVGFSHLDHIKPDIEHIMRTGSRRVEK